MEDLLHLLEPLPASALPARFPSPFDDVAPHPWAQHAALQLQAQLRTGVIAPGYSTALLEDRREGGKMFGVLLVRRPDGRVGVLKAFSGQLGMAWRVPGYVPPLFDEAAREVLEPASDVAVKSLTARMEALARGPELPAARDALAAVEARHQEERAALRAVHAERKRQRHAQREAAVDRTARRLLDDLSRRDDHERRDLEARLREERAEFHKPLHRLERRLAAMGRLRAAVSRKAMQQIQDTYHLSNARGERRLMRTLFAPREPPWGAGDCAAPKLIGFALAQGLTPLALAEFWWGPPPPGGGRVEGTFFPACREKCGPLLPFLLDGLDVAPRETWKPRAVADDELQTLWADERVVVVVKPAGLLSVPARDTSVTDSAWAKLRARFPHATGPLLVHRLDLDTSGLLLAALDLETHRILQSQFIKREIHKRYVAWLDGVPPGARGTVSLPLRVDLDQRPRQVVDFIHGKEAVTDWEVLERNGNRTRVAFHPRTGRTHQLRVHAAHADGLGAPIEGDRLYGRAAGRLMLHAESITFRHPDGRELTFTAPAPF